MAILNFFSLKSGNSPLDTRYRRTSVRDAKKGVVLSKTTHSVINIPSYCWHAIGISWNYAVWLMWYVMSIAIKYIKWTLSLGLGRISWCYILLPINVTVSVPSYDWCHGKLRSSFTLFLWVIFFFMSVSHNKGYTTKGSLISYQRITNDK